MPDSAPVHVETRPPRGKRRVGLVIFGLLVLIIVALLLLLLLWNWDWFIPIVEARASAAIGRKVTIGHLHVSLGRVTTVTLDDVAVANPDGFPQQQPLAHVDALRIATNVMDYLHTRTIVLPSIDVDKPVIAATALANGSNNFTFTLPASPPNEKPSAPPQIGDVRISDGTARVIDPKFRSNFTLGISTREASGSVPSAIVVDAKGTYAGQPVTGRFIGGALLSLRDAAHPYPINVHLANGATHVSLVGTVENPLNFAGARVKLELSGPDMAELYPLTGIPIPQTPPFSIAGNVDYKKPVIRFTDFAGRVGSSDLNGNIFENPGIGGKPDVTLDLYSRHVDLTDLGGFVGTVPGKASTPGETPSQQRQLAVAKHKTTLFPDTPINLPKLNAADIHLKYRGEHIENRATPFDNIVVDMDVADGRITLHPLDFAVGKGEVASNIDLDPGPHGIISTKANIRFHNINLSRVLQATHTFHGEGILGGEARIDANGNSLASMMGQSNGEVKLILLGGGNLSALLVDITGLEFGNALLSALGVPNRANLNCFVTDLPIDQGILSTKVLLADTTEGRITGRGTVDFRNQTLDYSITTRSKSFSIGSLPGPINITGPLGDPSIRPGAEVVARAGAAVGLGILLTPLGALLPTIQFGVGKDNACTKATEEEHAPLHVPRPARRHIHR
jgi:uncharacterized protein involved in outer membrane biogenesis